MMYYTIYKITNKINGKFYIGSHKTKNLDDNYMGSGKYLQYAQNKYGMENFRKEILFVFDTAKEMYAKESEIVNEEFVAEENTYNIKKGGFGGWDYINSNDELRYAKNKKARENANKNNAHIEGVKKLKWLFENDQEWLDRKINKFKKSISVYYESNHGSFYKRKHTEEAKEKIGLANKENSKGEKNSQFGTMWIHSLEEKKSKKIKKGDVIPEGWLPGRKIKF